ncbi:helix-turn-helix domain-containing protein [Levilactobacillus andaensis]|uniref:helix-turn-helix domain-containing protein n=1 Tax=Levilactobacillus andaensis TaxID=2799570 RepID=UPI001940BB74|nr:helix-turn-helix transcriptional regulator [Levilactobacillus andaensis]
MFVKSNALELLQERRKELGLSGAEVSRRMGLKTTQHYWNIENGKNRLTLEYAFLAADALNVPITFFCQKVKEKI